MRALLLLPILSFLTLTAWGAHGSKVLSSQSQSAAMAADYPTCSSADSDSDGDGWGWENNQSCIVDGSSDDDKNYCPPGTTPTTVVDGRAWGWVNNKSCEIDPNETFGKEMNAKVFIDPSFSQEDRSEFMETCDNLTQKTNQIVLCQLVSTLQEASVHLKLCPGTGGFSAEPLANIGMAICLYNGHENNRIRLVWSLMHGSVRSLQGNNDFYADFSGDNFDFYPYEHASKAPAAERTGLPSREAMQMYYEAAHQEEAPAFLGLKSNPK